MITARMTAGRRIAASLALAGLALGVTSCGAINQQSTTDHYAPSDGIVENVADAKVRNLMLVTDAEHDEARFIGSIVNSSDSSLSLTINAASTSAVEISVDANSALKLEDEEFSVSGLGIGPGQHAPATLSSGGESVETTIPVVDGTLKEYREFVPGGYDESTTDHLTPTETAGHGGH
ncbi:hypothetical protein OK351_15210 [Glutamicibacter sp. MNS18]|uniref:hypothetical protein n=1 Tax=Glutamicibacter sp. MNS18 TaxID=2989817 RepID=UPI0022356CD6|nr:hypothetical protein [Glutamicibacter sp. MNS18]MCW4466840.1 hypothetical protein [Glutamicibacter sp. MNS18]